MKVKALVSFSGLISMAKGEVAECPDGDILQDLLRAKYVEPVKGTDETSVKSPEKAKKRANK